MHTRPNTQCQRLPIGSRLSATCDTVRITAIMRGQMTSNLTTVVLKHSLSRTAAIVCGQKTSNLTTTVNNLQLPFAATRPQPPEISLVVMLLFVALLTMFSYWLLMALLVTHFGALLMTRFLHSHASITTGCGDNYDRRTYEVFEATIRVRPDNVVD